MVIISGLRCMDNAKIARTVPCVCDHPYKTTLHPLRLLTCTFHNDSTHIVVRGLNPLHVPSPYMVHRMKCPLLGSFSPLFYITALYNHSRSLSLFFLLRFSVFFPPTPIGTIELLGKTANFELNNNRGSSTLSLVRDHQCIYAYNNLLCIAHIFRATTMITRNIRIIL